MVKLATSFVIEEAQDTIVNSPLQIDNPMLSE